MGDPKPSVELIRGHVSSDQVHIFMSVPPHISLNFVMKSIKSRSFRKTYAGVEEFEKKHFGTTPVPDYPYGRPGKKGK